MSHHQTINRMCTAEDSGWFVFWKRGVTGFCSARTHTLLTLHETGFHVKI
jgi:hypothetical protein